MDAPTELTSFAMGRTSRIIANGWSSDSLLPGDQPFASLAHNRDRQAARILLMELIESDVRRVRSPIVIGTLTCSEGCIYCGAPHVIGRPDLFVSISHSWGWAAAALSTRPIGIDLEALTRRPHPASATHRTAFYSEWTRKEARWKSLSRILCSKTACSETQSPRIVTSVQSSEIIFSVALVPS